MPKAGISDEISKHFTEKDCGPRPNEYHKKPQVNVL